MNTTGATANRSLPHRGWAYLSSAVHDHTRSRYSAVKMTTDTISNVRKASGETRLTSSTVSTIRTTTFRHISVMMNTSNPLSRPSVRSRIR